MRRRRAGFTLIELSIVLVIIGLIVGGVLVGRDLISAAAVRAQITQIEKYQQAVNTFRGKYGALPGDIKDPDASNFGFQVRGQYTGQGDGNGVLEGVNTNNANSQYGTIMSGATSVFWNDLATARLVDHLFNASITSLIYVPNGMELNRILPEAAIGNGNYVYVWSGGPLCCHSNGSGQNGVNYYGLSSIVSIVNGQISSNPGVTVQQAYSIDTKIDDGLPQSGRVTAMYINPLIYVTWAGTAISQSLPWTAATAGSSTSCFDNGNVGGASQQYSFAQNNGTGMNCALSFQFQ